MVQVVEVKLILDPQILVVPLIQEVVEMVVVSIPLDMEMAVAVKDIGLDLPLVTEVMA